MVVFLNGSFIEEAEAKVSVFDRGLLYGDGLFETVRVYRRTPFRLREHLLRLREGARFLKIPIDVEIMPGVVDELLSRNALDEGYLRITLTRGDHTGKLDLESSGSTLLAVVTKLRPIPDAIYSEGVEAIFASGRVSPYLGRLKKVSFLPYLVAKDEARLRGAFEAILRNAAAEVVEGATSNVFALVGDKLLSPGVAAGALPGIARATVIELAHEEGISFSEGSLTGKELLAASEVFLTNSMIELVPVVRMEGRPIHDGRPGRIYQLLRRRYRERVECDCHRR